MAEDGVVVADAAEESKPLARIDYIFNERGASFLEVLGDRQLIAEAYRDQNEAAPHFHLLALLIITAAVAVVVFFVNSLFS